ncbi:hypothetical protein [Chryseobacterium binzhouense]|uniref:hypothetical protein n=1 Tax=Chryseobacterium binzhouense TaxID=2593646 RepID=UPI00117BFF7A|nr:hypothetical protein [Chryseobacterium binzhouense]
MKKIFTVFLFIFSLFSFGQKKLSINEIINSYPFNKTTKVKIISYNTDFLSEFPIPLPPIGKNVDSTMIKRLISEQTFPIKLEQILGKESLEGIKQIKTLNFKETFELSQLLYNTCGKFKNDMREVNKCFFPRNAVLFLNDNDKVFEILEICFECQRMQFNSEKSLEINGMCDNFYLKIEKLFKDNGFQTKSNRSY